MKTLYISDLDGTLLDRRATVPDETVRLLKELDKKDVPVTYATARTIESVRHILARVPLRCPVALMNGVVICDISDGEKYLFAAYFKDEIFEDIRDILRECHVDPFMYFLNDNRLCTAYEKISNKYMENFMAERIERYNKPFVCLGDGDVYPGRPIYFAAMDSEEKIRRADERCRSVEGIKTACYRDSYEPDFWYLEVFDDKASKKNAVSRLRALTGADQIVAFGDNYNDIPMFQASDVSYAVSSAPEDIRLAADGVIAVPELNGVPMKIVELEGLDIG